VSASAPPPRTPEPHRTPSERFTARFANPVLRRLLRSPLHGLFGEGLALLEVTGRRTGAVHTVPVNVKRDGDRLVAVSRAHRRWWRNLRGGAPLAVTLDGVRYSASATAQPTGDGEQVRVTITLGDPAPAPAGNPGARARRIPDGGRRR
jgi:F420H(2)-dependent quinone reductase